MDHGPFRIDQAFIASSAELGELPLSSVRLQADARFPWLVLIPRVAGARELEDLAAADRVRLIEEVVAAGAAVRAIGQSMGFEVEKLNVGALGNVTPQLHLHVVGRHRRDAAWPGPVWGRPNPEPYEAVAVAQALAAGRAALGL